MFIDRKEPAFPPVSAHKKPVNPQWDSAVAEYLEKVGATDLDAPDAPKRKTPRTDAQLRALAGIEHKKAEAQAQAEHRAALARLADGSAVHRQANDRTPVITKKVKAKKTAKPKVKAVKARKPRAKKYVKPKLTKSFHQPRKARLESRLKAMLKTLKAGGLIKMVSEKEGKGSGSPYYLQRKDIVRLSDRAGEDIIRIKDIGKDVSYFMFDRYPRYHTDKLIDMHEPKALLRALMSGELVYACDVKQKTVYVSKHVVNLARQYGFNIFAVYSTRYLIGWILLEETKPHWWADYLLVTLFMHLFNQLGDMCQALDYKKCQAAVKERMPDASASELSDAAFAEYKKVYLNGQ